MGFGVKVGAPEVHNLRQEVGVSERTKSLLVSISALIQALMARTGASMKMTL